MVAELILRMGNPNNFPKSIKKTDKENTGKKINNPQ